VILVVDDHRDSADAVALLLRKSGYPATVALSGHEVLTTLRAHPPEQPILVVLDEMMPLMSGMEVLREIRADPKIAATPVIFYTAGFDVQRRDEAITLGALAWFFKGGTGTSDLQMTLKQIIHIYETNGGAKTASPAK
jgi:CheY-like chemotaxis protein